MVVLLRKLTVIVKYFSDQADNTECGCTGERMSDASGHCLPGGSIKSDLCLFFCILDLNN
jgi:hypothetical protein